MTITALVRPLEAGLRADRWQPVRAGILNVWRYHEETFRFHRGRLLLRGPNGSGKSKALEILLPFLLDASLRPERLSTFRGSERSMHWNLMGDGYVHATRVGYVWLEFGRVHGQDQRWFTCGARLQASTGTRSVNPTYFTTSLRIGMPGGLSLVKGDNVPLTAADLSAALTGSGGLHDVPGYRRIVRETLFRGFTEEQYIALIGALLQLRTPKLSEHLDPDSLSELLTRALPPLDHQDVEEIAEGFEKLDRRKEDLEHLDREVAAAERLASRQRTYGRRVMRRAASELVSATTRLDNVTRDARAARGHLDQAEARLTSLSEEMERLEREVQAAQARIEGLQDSDAYHQGRELDRLREDAGRAQKHADRARGRAAGLSEEARHDARDLERVAGAAAQAESDVERAASRAAALGVQVRLEATVERMRPADPAQARGLLRAAVEARERQLADVRKALEVHEQALRELAAAIRRRDGQAQRLEEARARLAAAERRLEQAREQLRADVVRWAEGTRQLGLASRAAELAALSTDERALLDIVAAAEGELRERISREQERLGRERELLEAERSRIDEERRRLQAQGAIEPAPPPNRTADRMRRAGAPLWRVLDWRPGIPEEAQAGVEAALEAAGLLDAWILPDGGVQVEGHDNYLEAALSTPTAGRSLADLLVVDPASPVPPQRVEALLRGIAVGERAGGHVAAVGTDGSWQLASAHGTWAKPAASYLGATARERARRRRLDELQAEIRRLDGGLSAVGDGLAALDGSREELALELGRRPTHDTVGSAMREVDGRASQVASVADLLKVAEDERRHAEGAERNALGALSLTASHHRLPVSADALRQLGERLGEFRSAADHWVDCRVRLDGTRANHSAVEERVRRSARQAAEAESVAGDLQEEAAALQVRLEAVEESIGFEYRRVLDEVRVLREGARARSERHKVLNRDHSNLNGTIGELRSELRQVDKRREEAAVERDAAGARFRRLAQLTVGRDAMLSTDVSELPSTTAALGAARQVAEELGGASPETVQLREAESRLAEAMHEIRQTLAGRVDLQLEPDPECEVQVATAAVDGLAISPGELAQRLRAERAATRAQLSEEERELFDRTLTGDTRRHVAERIRLADALVRNMNRQLGEVRTASGLRVTLRWDVDPALEAGMREARALLLRDPATLSEQERSALHDFVRMRIDEVREAGTATGWEEQLLRVLDYREWHRFVVQVRRPGGEPQTVTKRVHGALSGGEKAIVLHLPLFAAVAGHYGAAPEAPRLILLDEVFVGVDQTNRGQLLDLVASLDLDMLLTSDHEWCTYAELDGIAIHQLITGTDGDDAVTTARFLWDGERLREEDPGEQ